MFVGREAEMKFLQDKYAEDGGQLIVLYGRRRVGKTETLREFCKDKPHVFFSCTQTTERVQLRNFRAGCSRRIFRHGTTFLNFPTGKRCFVRCRICPMATGKSCW